MTLILTHNLAQVFPKARYLEFTMLYINPKFLGFVVQPPRNELP